MNNKLILFAGIIISLLLIYTLNAVTITDLLNYPNPTITSNSTIQLDWNITTDNLKNLTLSWDNINYTLIDNSLIGWWQFNNFSSFGENDTKFVDLTGNSNGTLINRNGTYLNLTGGKENGAINFLGGNLTAGKPEYVQLSTNPIKNNTLNFTVSVWIKPYPRSSVATTDKHTFIQLFGLYSGWFSWYSSGYIHAAYHNATTVQAFSTAGGLVPAGQWSFITFTRSNTSYSIYINGVDQKDYTVGGVLDEADSPTIFGCNDAYQSLGYLSFNGSIDDIMMFNRTLSSSEIQQLYNTQFVKYNSTNLMVSTNQSLVTNLNSTNPIYNYSYSLCSSNLTSQSCLSSKIISATIPTYTITANFTNSVGNIRNDFYGWNIQNPLKIIGPRFIDTNCDGTAETLQNSTISSNAWVDMNIGISRIDMSLDTLYSNSSNGSVNRTGNLTAYKDFVTLAHNNNRKVLFIIDYLPSYEADNSSGMCTSLTRCIPKNYTRFNNEVIDFVNYTTSGGLYIDNVYLEMWNEPYLGSFFMGGFSTDSVTRALNYSYFYNKTYWGVKSAFPTVEFGGPSGFRSYPNLMKTFLSNASVMGYSWDFILHHPYGYTNTNQLEQLNDTNWVLGLCSTYGVSCPYIILSEYSVGDSILKNQSNGQSNQYGASWGQTYISLLNTYPANISSMGFNWDQQYSYFHCPGRYSEYPSKWDIFSQAGLDNPTQTYYPPYNITKNFAHYCPTGSTVYSSSASDSSINTVTCKKGNSYSLIIINMVSSKTIVTNAAGFTGTKNYQMDVSNGNLYLNNNTNNLGVMDSNQMKYLETPIFILDEYNNLRTKSASTGETYTDNNIWFSSSSNTEKHIASNHTIPIDLTVTINVTNQPTSIYYLSNTGTYHYTLTSSNWTYNTLTNTLTINLTGVEPANNSNVLTINYPSTSSSTNQQYQTSIISWDYSYPYDYKELNSLPPIEYSLAEGERINILVNSESHYVGVIDIIDDNITIQVGSTPQQAILTSGQSVKFDIDNDSSYDIQVKLNNIYSVLGIKKANITISYIGSNITLESKDISVYNSNKNNSSTCGIGSGKDLGVCFNNLIKDPGALFIIFVAIFIIYIFYKESKRKRNI